MSQVTILTVNLYLLLLFITPEGRPIPTDNIYRRITGETFQLNVVFFLSCCLERPIQEFRVKLY